MSRSKRVPSLTSALRKAESIVGKVNGDGSKWRFDVPVQVAEGLRFCEVTFRSEAEAVYMRREYVAAQTLAFLGFYIDHAFEAILSIVCRKRSFELSARDLVGEALVEALFGQRSARDR